ncbi:hypothetical protein SAMN02799630_03340 [Paenibacillus sp. UNCCL117]|nr:hypothetical protein SAMN04488602_12812 [Paenibacillus sp. cl123]SFW45927.1 hypothetical protein SAMN02799630_03340 [Paenibacillus sp. UNCCL117]
MRFASLSGSVLFFGTNTAGLICTRYAVQRYGVDRLDDQRSVDRYLVVMAAFSAKWAEALHNQGLAHALASRNAIAKGRQGNKLKHAANNVP